MGLTVREKDHWRERIAKRIDHRIETFVAKQDPTLLHRVAEQARRKAYESLGIDAQQREIEQIRKQKDEIEKREHLLKAEQRALIDGTNAEGELQPSYFRHETTVDQAVGVRAKALEAEILAQSDAGKQVLALREEKENLLDTVWLATSSTQIKELWEQVNALLERKPTTLDEEALKIEPVQDE